MNTHDIVVIGGSAGGLDALSRLLGKVPGDIPAAIFIALHTSPENRSLLPEVISRMGALRAEHPNGASIQRSRIYVAPPDRHMTLTRDAIRIVDGPKENRFRPALDPLFRTAAYSYGPRVIGVVLSGALDDGTVGLWEIKDRGGIALVQDPSDAIISGMPSSALRHVQIDRHASAEEIGSMLADLCRQPAPDESNYPVSKLLEVEAKMNALAQLPQHNVCFY